MQDTTTRYVVSDICDTLFYSNTTFDFIRFCVEKGWLDEGRQRRWRLLLRRQSPLFWMLAVLNKLTRADHHKKAAVGLLAGLPVATVRSWAATFYTEYLEQRRIIPAFDLLQQLADNTELVLASSSIEPVVAEIAAALHAHRYVATTLQEQDGKYTGRITLDLTGRKLDALVSLIRLERGNLVAVLSDNTTDRTLMELAEQKYALCYNEQQRQFWQSIPQINLLQVSSGNVPAS